MEVLYCPAHPGDIVVADVKMPLVRTLIKGSGSVGSSVVISGPGVVVVVTGFSVVVIGAMVVVVPGSVVVGGSGVVVGSGAAFSAAVEQS